MNKQTEALKEVAMIQIKSRYDDSVLFECEAENIKECVCKAVNGGAYLSGEILTKAPISILNLTWDILITDNYMRIGCRRHTHDEWANFNDLQIHNMESRAIEFWTSNRDWLLAACKAHKGLET